VMEGKAALFKRFGDVDAIPICLGTQNADEIVRTVQLLAPSFGGINLEDICAPRCFEVEDRLRALLDIPVFHDDQHGTAIVVAAALTNALRVVGKELPELRLVLSGVGAAGSAIARLLLSMGAQRITLVDRAGIVRPCHMEDPLRKALAERLKALETRFVIEPGIRFQGLVGEQATMFLFDPCGNALEFKAFR
ncbi:MAG: malic enzyme-like NAD(P)-binding protein, partial [Oscillospiraceae bacterium]